MEPFIEIHVKVFLVYTVIEQLFPWSVSKQMCFAENKVKVQEVITWNATCSVKKPLKIWQNLQENACAGVSF